MNASIDTVLRLCIVSTLSLQLFPPTPASLLAHLPKDAYFCAIARLNVHRMCLFLPRTVFTSYRMKFSTLVFHIVQHCALIVLFCNGLSAQTSPVARSTSSILSLNPSNVVMERRPFTTAFPMTVPPPTYITVHRTNATGAAIVLFSADYQTASGVKLTNADLQRDLGTTQLSLDNSGLASNVLFFEPGQTLGYLVFYPIRVNFQRNEDRILTVNILPSRPGFGQTYTIAPTTGTVRLTLKDNTSASSEPFLLNAVQNASMTNGSVTLIELETPGTRSDGLPSRVFANENGSPLTYSTTSLNPDIVRSEIVPAQARTNNLAGLRLTAVNTGMATIMVVAVDDKKRAATTFFDVNVQINRTTTSVRANAADSEFTYAPNPTNDLVLLRGLQPRSVYRLITTTGQELLRRTSEQASEALSLREFPQGAYLLVVETNGRYVVRTLVRQ